jgi:LCP family protein required for cell wall assembly
MRYLNLKKNKRINSVPKPPKRKKGLRWVLLGVVLLVVIGFIILFGDKAKAIFDPISVVANVAPINLEATDGRTNILVLGSDKRKTGEVTSELTDTILIASISTFDHNVVLISLPRDLWVESSTGVHKINETYARGGAPELQKVLKNVLGIPVHYYAVVDFALFREVIDTLGGVKVDVESAFVDYWFPIEGMENAPNESDRYETISFKAGVQVMDGGTALKYVRSRKGDNGEGTDFARSKRQQKVIMAIKEKILSVETLVNPKKLKELHGLYSKNVDTNMDFGVIQQFYLLSQQIEFDGVRTIVLDDRSASSEGGLLYAPVDTTLYEGAYVLIPRAGDFSQIRAYVQRFLFEL